MCHASPCVPLSNCESWQRRIVNRRGSGTRECLAPVSQPGLRFPATLVRGTRRKMKRLAPTVFVEICHEIVVLVDEMLVVRLPLFQATRLVTAVSTFVAASSGCNRVALEHVLRYVGELRGHGENSLFARAQNKPQPRVRLSSAGSRQDRRVPASGDRAGADGTRLP